MSTTVPFRFWETRYGRVFVNLVCSSSSYFLVLSFSRVHFFTPKQDPLKILPATLGFQAFRIPSGNSFYCHFFIILRIPSGNSFYCQFFIIARISRSAEFTDIHIHININLAPPFRNLHMKYVRHILRHLGKERVVGWGVAILGSHFT